MFRFCSSFDHLRNVYIHIYWWCLFVSVWEDDEPFECLGDWAMVGVIVTALIADPETSLGLAVSALVVIT